MNHLCKHAREQGVPHFYLRGSGGDNPTRFFPARGFIKKLVFGKVISIPES
jgi:hypothetical protein